jgi:hypothetical protein
MRRLIAPAAVAAVLALAAVGAADAAAKKGTDRSLDPVRGRFHQLHTKKLGLNCSSCHTGQQDVLFLRGNEPLPAGMPGQVNRSVCLGCHTAPATPAWYGLPKR